MEDRDEMRPKVLIKDMLGDLPFTAEVYWLLHHGNKKIHSRFNLEALAAHLPEMVAQVTPYANSATPGKKIFVFASLHFWINHTVVTGLVLRGLGHEVTLATSHIVILISRLSASTCAAMRCMHVTCYKAHIRS